MPPLTPVPLTVFRSNSKLDQNFESSSLKYTQPITTKFLHTSWQLHCRDLCKIPMWSVEYILNQNTAYFGRIWSKYRQWDGRQVGLHLTWKLGEWQDGMTHHILHAPRQLGHRQPQPGQCLALPDLEPTKGSQCWPLLLEPVCCTLQATHTVKSLI